jgi:outer membrane protein
MKQFSTILSLLLLPAVGFLYYLQFKPAKTGSLPLQNSLNSVLAAPAPGTASPNGIIAYVDLDSIQHNVKFISAQKKELEAEQQSMAAEYQNAYMQMENDKNNFKKKGDAITREEYEQFVMTLQQREQQIEMNRQDKSKKLADKSTRIMENMQSRLKAFLNEYNKDGRYTYILATGTGLEYIFYKDSTRNITQEIVKGLNESAK